MNIQFYNKNSETFQKIKISFVASVQIRKCQKRKYQIGIVLQIGREMV